MSTSHAANIAQIQQTHGVTPRVRRNGPLHSCLDGYLKSFPYVHINNQENEDTWFCPYCNQTTTTPWVVEVDEEKSF